MRTLLIPPTFLAVYAATLLLLAWLIMPGERSNAPFICYLTANAATKPSLPLLAKQDPRKFNERTEERFQEMSY